MIIKKLFRAFIILIILINLIIVLSGKSWLYKAISITYLKGYNSSYIGDFIYFDQSNVSAGDKQSWLLSENYNDIGLPKSLQKLHNKNQSVAFLIIVNDSISYEKYWREYSSTSMSNSFSMAKSWVATLIGAAIKDGYIKSVDQRVGDFLPEFRYGQKSKITIKHLLTMSSGLNWNENYYNPLGQTAEAYYGDNLKKLTLNLRSIDFPGKTFIYHSSCTQILSFVIESATNKTISKYMSEKLWVPMGASKEASWSTDNHGNEKAFCCINSNARDFARIGKLYLNYGVYNNVRIIDSSFVKQAVTPSNLVAKNGLPNERYGYHFWITRHKGLNVFYSRGHLGQYVICVPEKNMIIVRLGEKSSEELPNGHHKDLYEYLDGALEMFF